MRTQTYWLHIANIARREFETQVEQQHVFFVGAVHAGDINEK